LRVAREAMPMPAEIAAKCPAVLEEGHRPSSGPRATGASDYRAVAAELLEREHRSTTHEQAAVDDPDAVALLAQGRAARGSLPDARQVGVDFSCGGPLPAADRPGHRTRAIWKTWWNSAAEMASCPSRSAIFPIALAQFLAKPVILPLQSLDLLRLAAIRKRVLSRHRWRPLRTARARQTHAPYGTLMTSGCTAELLPILRGEKPSFDDHRATTDLFIQNSSF
jgi:hypothetical protein